MTIETNSVTIEIKTNSSNGKQSEEEINRFAGSVASIVKGLAEDVLSNSSVTVYVKKNRLFTVGLV